MNFQIKYFRIISFSGVLFFLLSSLKAQEIEIELLMQPHTYKLGDTLTIPLGTEVRIGDSLVLKLNYFSHKTPFADGPTKATALLSVSDTIINEELLLSVYGHIGRSDINYETKFWNGFRFQLIEFNYDRSITVIVEKGEEEMPFRKLFKL